MDATTNALPEGTILQGAAYQYVLGKALGQGAFGITYLAGIIPKDGKVIPGLSLKVAIKEFFMKDINSREDQMVTIGAKSRLFAEYRAKFLREANNLSKMSHKNIVNVLEAFEQNNTVYYAMEFIDGGSLDDYILEKGHLAEAEAVLATWEIGSAIAYMHSLQMLHLDVKPLNIMRKQDGSLRLIDFGLSKQYDENGEPESSTSVGGGTPGYAPLEQISFKDGHEFPVTMDVYALGATLYKMLTGKRPPLASDILNDGFPLCELSACGISAQTQNAVAAAMQPMKKNRPQSINSFLDLLPQLGSQGLSSASKTMDTNGTMDPEEVTEVEIVDVEVSRFENRVIHLGNNTSLIRCSYADIQAHKYDIQSYCIEISEKRVKVSYSKGNGNRFRRSYFFSPANYHQLLKDINGLQLQVKSNNPQGTGVDKQVDLMITENHQLCYDCSNHNRAKPLLDGNVECLCVVLEKLVRIDKLIIHQNSSFLHKVMYFLFRNIFY